MSSRSKQWLMRVWLKPRTFFGCATKVFFFVLPGAFKVAQLRESRPSQTNNGMPRPHILNALRGFVELAHIFRAKRHLVIRLLPHHSVCLGRTRALRVFNISLLVYFRELMERAPKKHTHASQTFANLLWAAHICGGWWWWPCLRAVAGHRLHQHNCIFVYIALYDAWTCWLMGPGHLIHISSTSINVILCLLCE